MSSLQNGAPGTKSLKFANALDPFSGFLGRESQYKEESSASHDTISTPLTEQFDSRLRLNPIGLSGASAVGNTVQENIQPQPQSQQLQQNSGNQLDAHNIKKQENVDDNNSDDSDFDSDFEDDPTLEAFRQKRLEELRNAQTKQAENRSKGHGEVRTISQDEFLPECTSSEYVVVHFFHKEFERCKIMDHHLKRISHQHLSCKFIRIDAEKAPFFVVKLKIQTLPTLIVFKDSKVVERLVGFEDLVDVASKHPDEFTTGQLGYWLEKAGAIEYEGPDSDDEHDDGRVSTTRRPTTTKGLNRYFVYDEDI